MVSELCVIWIRGAGTVLFGLHRARRDHSPLSSHDLDISRMLRYGGQHITIKRWRLTRRTAFFPYRLLCRTGSGEISSADFSLNAVSLLPTVGLLRYFNTIFGLMVRYTA